MSKGNKKGPCAVFVLKDNIRGHENQSTGIAWWLSELGGASVELLTLPKLSGWLRFLWYKVRSRSLKNSEPDVCRKWLWSVPEGEGLLRDVEQTLKNLSVEAEGVLFISAGSSAAPWCLALARAVGGKCCTIMTPSVLCTRSFDLAIVPEHDFPEADSNTLVTLGAPNMIRPDLLKEGSRKLSKMYPPTGRERWAILLGGDDANYTLSPFWIEGVIPDILNDAEKAGADVYITTSRRTSPEAERAAIKTAKDRSSVRALILASREGWNPVPGMLGLCGKVFCTEDSVSMISEAFTAGCEVEILRVERNRSIRRSLQEATRWLVSKGLIPRKFLWGVPRFDMMIDSFERVYEKDFNEARRAAIWLIEEWNS